MPFGIVDFIDKDGLDFLIIRKNVKIIQNDLLQLNNKTMSLLQLIKDKKREILDLAEKYGAYNIRIFGSVDRGDDDEKSDIDFLVDFKEGVSLLDWGGLLMDLKDLLGHNVDVATEKVLKQRIKDRILREAQPL